MGRGVDEWDNYNLSERVLGAEEDEGDVLVVKSGTDFRDISEICLELKDTPETSIRKKLIRRVIGKPLLITYRIHEGHACTNLPRKASPDKPEPAVLWKASQGSRQHSGVGRRLPQSAFVSTRGRAGCQVATYSHTRGTIMYFLTGRWA